MRNFFLVVALSFLLTGCIPNAVVRTTQPNTRAIEIGGHAINAVLADEPAEQAKGLAGVESLADSEGMLFVFRNDGEKTFWMKGMVMPIDIIWINNSTVIGFEKNALPEPGVSEAELTLYESDEPADLVLEVRAGFVDDYDIQIGDPIVFK